MSVETYCCRGLCCSIRPASTESSMVVWWLLCSCCAEGAGARMLQWGLTICCGILPADPLHSKEMRRNPNFSFMNPTALLYEVGLFLAFVGCKRWGSGLVERSLFTHSERPYCMELATAYCGLQKHNGTSNTKQTG
jgi:hypothetical protein